MSKLVSGTEIEKGTSEGREGERGRRMRSLGVDEVR